MALYMLESRLCRKWNIVIKGFFIWLWCLYGSYADPFPSWQEQKCRKGLFCLINLYCKYNILKSSRSAPKISISPTNKETRPFLKLPFISSLFPVCTCVISISNGMCSLLTFLLWPQCFPVSLLRNRCITEPALSLVFFSFIQTMQISKKPEYC